LKYAKKEEGYGIGFTFSEDGPFTGIDFDDCINEDGKITRWVSEIVQKAGSYTEISPSGNGLHIIGKGKIPNDFKNPITPEDKNIEIYDHDRFFTVTGRVLK